MDSNNPSYESDLDGIISQAKVYMNGQARIQKIGLTLSREIASQRLDVQSAVGDFHNGQFSDGLFFIPRPYTWLSTGTYVSALETIPRVALLEKFLASILEKTGIGLLAYDLVPDGLPIWERAYLEEHFVARRQVPTAFAEPMDKSTVHLLLRNPESVAIKQENGPIALEKLTGR